MAKGISKVLLSCDVIVTKINEFSISPQPFYDGFGSSIGVPSLIGAE